MPWVLSMVMAIARQISAILSVVSPIFFIVLDPAEIRGFNTGVVGGVTTVILIVIITFLVVRRGRKNRDKDPQPQQQSQGSPANSREALSAPPVDDTSVSSVPAAVPGVPPHSYVGFSFMSLSWSGDSM